MPVRFPKIGFKFLKSAEFRARQLWLDFGDAVGFALEKLEPIKIESREWMKKWKKDLRKETDNFLKQWIASFRSKPIAPATTLQLELPYPLNL